MYDYSALSERDNCSCLICQSNESKVLGVRGNREYFGADPETEPHCVTSIVKCLNCGFVYINPTFDGIDDVEAIYYSSVELYKYELRKSVQGMFQKRVDILKQHAVGVDGYDVGPGKGEFLRQLRENNFIAEGVEPSKNFCEFGRREYGLTMHNSTLEQLPDKKQVSFISALHSLEHMNDPHGFIEKAHHLLKDDGCMYIEVPNTDAYIMRAIDFMFKVIGLGWSSRLCPLHQPFHKYGYNESSLRYLLEMHGFTVDSIFTLTGTDRGYTKYSGLRGLVANGKYRMTQFIDLFGGRECLGMIAKKN